MNRCACKPPINPLGFANADAGELWQCPLCDRYWTAAVTRDSAGSVVDDLSWVRVPKRHESYYLQGA